MSNFSREVARLDPERRELLELLLKTNQAQTASLAEALGRKDAPLSFPQQGFWLFDQIEPNSCVYNVPLAARLLGPLEPKLLEEGLARVVGRHEILRTACAVRDGQPAQMILPEADVPLPVIDLGHLDETARESAALERARQMALETFDLCRAPLLRSALFRLKPQDHLLVLVTHHFVIDGWSVELLLRELATFYRSLALGDGPLLPELALQYADYAVWQQSQLGSAQWESDLAYWMKELEGAPEILALPTDRPRPRTQSYRGSTISFTLPAPLSQALRMLSRREGATLFMTLMAGFQALLHRYTGEDDIMVSTAVSNRNRIETEGLIGSFANTVLLRSDMSDNPTFRMLLNRVREAAVRAYAYQDLPFEKLIEKFKLERDLSRNPLSQVMFLLHQQNLDAGFDLPGLRSSVNPIDIGTTKFDLSVTMTEGNQELSGWLQYSAELFDADTMDRLIGHFHTLLEGIVTDPGRQLSDLPLLTKAERHRLLIEWNDTKRDYPEDKCIHEFFEAQAERTPEAVAAVFEDQQLTYRELNEKANHIAFSLTQRGVGKSSYVPFLMDRSIEVVISMLAIMKTGAAFVPLDSRWPLPRIRQVLEDLESAVILVNRATPYQEKELDRSLLIVDGQSVCEPAANLEVSTDSREPIYAIYTSGSTGRPKAAVVPHRGITNRFLWMNEFFGADVAATVLQTTPHMYDSAVWQIFWPLINGGKTIIPSPGMETVADYLSSLIETYQVTITDFVPAVFNTLVPQLVTDETVRQKLKSLRSVIVGGEEITPTTTYSFMERFPEVRIINLYGPTEASIGCIYYQVTGKEGGKIPIGRPISNVQVLILDRTMNPVPVGVIGELYLSGICLGLGYLNDAEKTKSVFVDNRFVEVGCDKLYKTGDMSRYLPDGNIEFIGRIDHQVKIRGFRIELGEIESVLGQHAQVREAVVLAREESGGDENLKSAAKRLVAYVVPREGEALTVDELRSFLKQKLPEYMVPSAFVFLERLPLTPNGKVDRKSLPAPDQGRPGLESRFVPPRTPVEKTLASIWAQILKLEQVGVQDNFFSLGGHSLLATQVISRVREALKVELPLRALFEKPTIEELSSVVMALKEEEHERFDRLVSELEALSDEEAKRLLAR